MSSSEEVSPKKRRVRGKDLVEGVEFGKDGDRLRCLMRTNVKVCASSLKTMGSLYSHRNNYHVSDDKKVKQNNNICIRWKRK